MHEGIMEKGGTIEKRIGRKSGLAAAQTQFFVKERHKIAKQS